MKLLIRLVGILAMACSASTLAATCAELGQLSTKGLIITAAETKAASATASNGAEQLLPAHCRVAAVLSPTDDSHIEMEIWLPADNWNGKFLALGNGGWAGSISFSAMATGLHAGYAVASNDTGHQGGSAAFAIGHPEKVVDFAWRAMHEMTVHSKAIITSYYGRSARLSYYEGCSTGGRQGLMSAQRFPNDFDAIIAGAPVYNQLALNGAQFHDMQTLSLNASRILPAAKVKMLHEAVMAACEVNDKVADGFLNNPLACNFQAETLQCSGDDNDSCLTAEQLISVKNVYQGVFASDGTQLYPGHALGFEQGWRMPEPGSTPAALQTDAFFYIGHEDPNWDWREFDIETDLALVREKAGYIEALDTDLKEFQARGGVLLLYHGWNDPGPAPINTINYYQGVLQTASNPDDNWMRLFMMPGMGHCRGGIGPDQADFLSTLDAWRDTGVVPETITATRVRDGQVDMTRPLCAYPAVAQWQGTGSTDEAANYSCVQP